MALEFSRASAEDDIALQQFLGGLGVPVPSVWWGRAFSPAAPRGAASQPYLVRDLNDDAIIAFAAARDAELTFAGGTFPALVLHDVHCAGTEDGARAAGILLAELMRRVAVSFAAGPSLRATLALEASHWQRAGWFLRARIDPPQRHAAPAPSGLHRDAADQSTPPPDGPVARFVRSAPCRHWLAQGDEVPPAEHWHVENAFEASLRTSPGSLPGSEENLVVDLQVNEADPPASFRRLAEAARASGRTTYLSIMAPQFLTAIRQAGWSILQPRWSLYWTVGSPASRDLARDLAECRQWWVTPMDVELDRVPTGDPPPDSGAPGATPPQGTP